jgi:hypothetical protein
MPSAETEALELKRRCWAAKAASVAAAAFAAQSTLIVQVGVTAQTQETVSLKRRCWAAKAASVAAAAFEAQTALIRGLFAPPQQDDDDSAEAGSAELVSRGSGNDSDADDESEGKVSVGSSTDSDESGLDDGGPDNGSAVSGGTKFGSAAPATSSGVWGSDDDKSANGHSAPAATVGSVLPHLVVPQHRAMSGQGQRVQDAEGRDFGFRIEQYKPGLNPKVVAQSRRQVKTDKSKDSRQQAFMERRNIGGVINASGTPNAAATPFATNFGSADSGDSDILGTASSNDLSDAEFSDATQFGGDDDESIESNIWGPQVSSAAIPGDAHQASSHPAARSLDGSAVPVQSAMTISSVDPQGSGSQPSISTAPPSSPQTAFFDGSTVSSASTIISHDMRSADALQTVSSQQGSGAQPVSVNDTTGVEAASGAQVLRRHQRRMTADSLEQRRRADFKATGDFVYAKQKRFDVTHNIREARKDKALQDRRKGPARPDEDMNSNSDGSDMMEDSAITRE